MKECKRCKNAIKIGNLCQSCYKYERNGGIWHNPSKYGEMKYDDDGKPICHVCGMACNKLIEHTKRKHGLQSEEYRAEFGLMKSARLTSPMYHDKMSHYSEMHETFVLNFKQTWNGELRYVGGRKKNSWTAQEQAIRKTSQSHNARVRYEKKKLQEVHP